MVLVSWALLLLLLLLLLPPAAACLPMDWSLPAEVPPGGWAQKPRWVRFMAAEGSAKAPEVRCN